MPQLVLQLDLLRSHVFSLEQTNSELQHEMQRLREDDQRLQDQIARLKRNSSHSPNFPNSSKSPYLGVHESGHKDSREKLWTWCFRAPEFTVFHIDPSRLCWSHLIRDIRFLAGHTDKSLQIWGNKLLPWVRQLLETWHRAESVTTAGFTRAMDRIRRDFLKVVRQPPQRAETDNYFRFLTTPGIEPTNNQTEQAIRRIVIDRHITQGTRGKRGPQWRQRVWTILATCRPQKRRLFEFFCEAIDAHFQ